MIIFQSDFCQVISRKHSCKNKPAREIDYQFSHIDGQGLFVVQPYDLKLFVEWKIPKPEAGPACGLGGIGKC